MLGAPEVGPVLATTTRMRPCGTGIPKPAGAAGKRSTLSVITALLTQRLGLARHHMLECMLAFMSFIRDPSVVREIKQC